MGFQSARNKPNDKQATEHVAHLGTVNAWQMNTWKLKQCNHGGGLSLVIVCRVKIAHECRIHMTSCVLPTCPLWWSESNMKSRVAHNCTYIHCLFWQISTQLGKWTAYMYRVFSIPNYYPCAEALWVTLLRPP